MVRIELMPWEKAREDASRVRFEVFVEEQKVPREIELDEHDPACVHALAYAGEQPVATGRLLPDGHIGRMAVLKEWRRRGIGGQILSQLTEAARRRGDRQIVLSAQVHAVPFYRAHGFEAQGPTYLEAGIPHQDMRRRL
jgi:predicted GNAT family N-acyltransferase